MKINILILLILLIFMIMIIYFSYKKINNESFLNKFIGDGNMTFPYLSDPYYDYYNLNKYYFNDDLMTNYKRNKLHPQQLKNGAYFGLNANSSGASNKIFTDYSVRI